MTEVLCFDMYGTLCDTTSVTERLGDELEVSAALVAALDRTWRRKQLQYSYQTGLMESYEPFWTLTERALDYTLAQYDLDPDSVVRDRIVDAYNRLDPFPDALETLDRLGDAGYIVTVLSNGNPAMLDRLAANTGLDAHLDDVISADEVQTFKPAPTVYENAADHVGYGVGACRLVSANAWDVAGAGAAGMATGWVNRTRDPPEAIGATPDVMAPSLAALADVLVD